MSPFQRVLSTLTLSSVLLLGGCAATQVALTKQNLNVQTRMSRSIFLDPVANKQKTVFLAVRNTTDQQSFHIRSQLVSALQSKGYRVTSNFNQAHYLLQVNVLAVGATTQAAADKVLGGGFGSVIGGAAFGAGVGALTGDGTAALAGGLIGAAVSTVADSLVKDVIYTAVTDVKLSVRQPDNQLRAYTTRIVSTAEKVNLKFAAAEPRLETGLAQSIAGIF